MPCIRGPKRQNPGPMELAPPAKRQGLPIRKYEMSKPQIYKGIRVLPSDTPCIRVPRNDFKVNYERTEMTDKEIIETLTSQDTTDSKALEAPYASFFGDYSDEEFTKGLREALKVKKQMDMEEQAREEAEQRQRVLEAIAEYEEKRKELLMSMALSDEEEDEESENQEEVNSDTDKAEDQESESEYSDSETESEAESEFKFETLEAEEQDENNAEICEETVVFDGCFEVVCEEEVITSN
ncbi:hypothetical protein CAEBREN_22440 [Caenorhabditis brenneri]|uniref:Uncharacterized protein n=1 Tax=Caenorhabditis brenneri TaxID=135651 RepID=G0NM37_CAEBE|nr:hypothetical protein CAEBREN_22440 [Caenorhabditis brenneri]